MNKIRFQLNISVYQVLGHDENGELITKFISTIIDEILNRTVKDNEYKALQEAYLAKENEYCTIDVAKTPGCEWLFYKLVWNYWKMIADEYYKMNIDNTKKNPHLYRIELPNNMIIFPSLWVLSLEYEEPNTNYTPKVTEYKELSDGNLELVKAGDDLPVITELSKVVKIDDSAFLGYRWTLFASFPNCREVGQHAFSGCFGLKSIKLPKVEHIGLAAFNECHFLRTFSYPENLIDIGDSAFYGCMNLHGFFKNDGTLATTLPDKVKVGEDAFAYTPMDHLSTNSVYDPAIGNADDF